MKLTTDKVEIQPVYSRYQYVTSEFTGGNYHYFYFTPTHYTYTESLWNPFALPRKHTAFSLNEIYQSVPLLDENASKKVYVNFQTDRQLIFREVEVHA